MRADRTDGRGRPNVRLAELVDEKDVSRNILDKETQSESDR